MTEKPYKGVVLSRAFSTRLTDEDYEILYAHGPGVRTFYGYADRRDAEKMFCAVDSKESDNASKKENVSNRRD